VSPLSEEKIIDCVTFCAVHSETADRSCFCWTSLGQYAFASLSRCPCCRWQVPVHHEVVLLIITFDPKFLAWQWKLGPTTTPRNARWNPAVGVVMKSQTFFIFCFCGGSGVVIMPHPALCFVSYSFLPAFHQVQIIIEGMLMLGSPEFLLSWPCCCEASCWYENFQTIKN
jgi:hypothetical protein